MWQDAEAQGLGGQARKWVFNQRASRGFWGGEEAQRDGVVKPSRIRLLKVILAACEGDIAGGQT